MEPLLLNSGVDVNRNKVCCGVPYELLTYHALCTLKEYQHDLCSVWCELYQWYANTWSTCSLHESTSTASSFCGVGLQTRSVRYTVLLCSSCKVSAGGGTLEMMTSNAAFLQGCNMKIFARVFSSHVFL